MRTVFIYVTLLLLTITSSAQTADGVSQTDFNSANQCKNWKLKFQDRCTKSWERNWFLDGLKATVVNSNQGMHFSAGNTVGDDACHAVLWTKKSFKGDIKITYDYTRTDTCQEFVNILYIHATGIGKTPYLKDISQWNNLRTIPRMSIYFKNMNTLHLSYAAFDAALPAGQDYIRLRKYPVEPNADFNKTTEIAPAFFDTKLFQPGKTYHITVIYKANKLYFQVAGDEITKLYSWNISSELHITEGRVGLRHMYTRSSLYKNFKIYTNR